MNNLNLIKFRERRGAKEMNTISSIRKDFLASNLRSQVDRLNSVLNNIEEERTVDIEYASDSLKEVELKLRQIRKLCVES
jgi:hypothetical protein